MRNSHSCYYLLLQIHKDKIHAEKFCYKLIEYKNSDQYDNKYLVFNKMIHEVTDSAAISSDKTAAV